MKKFLWVAAATLPLWSAPAQSGQVAQAADKHGAAEHRATAHHVKASDSHSEAFDNVIAEQAKIHGVPEGLIHRVVQRESRYDPSLIHRSYLGLMQITYATARTMGYKGDMKGLLDARTNLIYAVPYLANAYIVADQNLDRAVTLYASGYYYEAKRKHLLALLRSASSEPVEPPPAVTVVAETPPPAPVNPVTQLFHALLGPANPPPEASAPVQQSEVQQIAAQLAPAKQAQHVAIKPPAAQGSHVEPQTAEAPKLQIAEKLKSQGKPTQAVQTKMAQAVAWPSHSKPLAPIAAKTTLTQVTRTQAAHTPVARTQIARAQVEHSEAGHSEPELPTQAAPAR
jgi:hypothetical protein